MLHLSYPKFPHVLRSIFGHSISLVNLSIHTSVSWYQPFICQYSVSHFLTREYKHLNCLLKQGSLLGRTWVLPYLTFPAMWLCLFSLPRLCFNICKLERITAYVSNIVRINWSNKCTILLLIIIVINIHSLAIYELFKRPSPIVRQRWVPLSYWVYDLDQGNLAFLGLRFLILKGR